MTNEAATVERRAQVLGILAERGLKLACALQERALEAETAEDMAALALAFHRISRTVRQSLALDAKLDRMAALAARETAEQAERAQRAAIRAQADERRAPTPADEICERVRGALNRLIWTEAEGDEEEYDILTSDLEHRLGEAMRREDFEALSIEDLILDLKADMALEGDLRLTPCRPPARPAPPPGSPDTG